MDIPKLNCHCQVCEKESYQLFPYIYNDDLIHVCEVCYDKKILTMILE